MFPGPGKGKSKSDMPKKAKDQCAESGKCKVNGASKVSMKQAAKNRQKKVIAGDDDKQKDTPIVRPKFDNMSEEDRRKESSKKKTKMKVGGMVNKMEPASRSFSSNSGSTRQAQGSSYLKR